MRIKYALLLTLFCAKGLAQSSHKPVIDTGAIDHWTYASDAKISGDGKYVSYTNGPDQFISATNSNWRLKLHQVNIDFLADNKHALLRAAGDSLFMLQLGTTNKKYIGQVAAIEPVLKGSRSEWIAYKTKHPGEIKEVHVRNALSEQQFLVKGLLNYVFNPNSEVILYQTANNNNDKNTGVLHWLDLNTGKEETIYSGNKIKLRLVAFDRSGKQVCFLDTDRNSNRYAWYFKAGTQKAAKIQFAEATLIDKDLVIAVDEAPEFNKDGSKIFLHLIEMDKPFPAQLPNAAQLTVWSYTDTFLQGQQSWFLRGGRPKKRSLAVMDPASGKLSGLFKEGEGLEEDHLGDANNYVLVKTGTGGWDFWWQESGLSAIYLINLQNGQRTLIKDSISWGHNWTAAMKFKLSPDERFVTWYDPAEQNYFSYEIASGISRNVTSFIQTNWRDESNHWESAPFAFPVGIAGWLKNDSAMLIYDNYDIWDVDPLGTRKAINMTCDYGKSQNEQLRVNAADQRQPAKVLQSGSKILLSSFDAKTKERGFYELTIGKHVAPRLLTKGPYTFGEPIKAEQANAWIITRESAVTAPNFYFSKDLKSFTALTDINPQRKYNWLTSELIRWTALDGTDNDGILYKPENFDPAKKYPVIFSYYELQSRDLNVFRRPGLVYDGLNIPWFVSRGYIVCIPDTHTPVTSIPGDERAINSVYSAARYLVQFPWVDAKHMGIQGHSYGGKQTIELLTNTHIFAAAAEGAGPADQLSIALQFTGLGSAGLFNTEIGQGGRNKSIWEDKDYYKNRNYILKADQVTTPLLMMHNKDDGSVPWEQGWELFTSLWRLGKRVWWLQYDRGSHGVTAKEDAMDYTIRMTQFFDHYLKGVPAPVWMTQGIPATLKGTKMGYELDTTGREPEERRVFFKGKLQLVRDAVKEDNENNKPNQ